MNRTTKQIVGFIITVPLLAFVWIGMGIFRCSDWLFKRVENWAHS